MRKEVWLNLPVKDLQRSRAFFAKVGFEINQRGSNDDMLCLLVGEKKFVVMLFKESVFAGFVSHALTDTRQSCEVLISFDAESREEVDALVESWKAAGGSVYAGPGEKQGWMYGAGLADPDGHRWNVLHMDHSKMPKG